MIWRIEIKEKPGVFDSVGNGVLHDIRDLGIDSVRDVRVVSVFTIEGDIDAGQVETICRELLVDQVVQEYCFSDRPKVDPQKKGVRVGEVALNRGVMELGEASSR